MFLILISPGRARGRSVLFPNAPVESLIFDVSDAGGTDAVRLVVGKYEWHDLYSRGLPGLGPPSTVSRNSDT